MNSISKFSGILIIITVLTAGCITSSNTRPEWVHNVNWEGFHSDKQDKIESALWEKVVPYKIDYDNVNISVKNDKDKLHIRVIATSNSTEFLDIYEFIYSNKTLTSTGYILEAIPQQDRESAISAAIQNINDSGIVGIPSVRRILPDTSEKYYAPITLLSVTWRGEISALVNPQNWEVVRVWKENGS